MLIVLDTETTGLDPATARIVELTLANVSGNDLHLWTKRFNPQVLIPPEATKVHGITDAHVANESLFATLAGYVQDWVDNATGFLGHNLRFDVPLLQRHLREAGQRGVPAVPWHDTLVKFRQDCPHDLTHAVKRYLGREHDGAHGSRKDAIAAYEVWVAQGRPRDLNLDLTGSAGARWLDACHYLYDVAGVVHLGFGKHRGRPAREVPDYLRWMRRSDFPPDTIAIINRLGEP